MFRFIPLSFENEYTDEVILTYVLSCLLSSPYPYEINSGVAAEPLAGYLINDQIDKDKVLVGVRLSYLNPTESDAIIAPEIQVHSASTVRRSGGDLILHTDYFFEGGIAFYEIYNPLGFRFALGGGAEHRVKTSFDLYYRVGLGGYFSRYFGIYGDFGGRAIFRTDEEQFSYPIDLSLNAQIIF